MTLRLLLLALALYVVLHLAGRLVVALRGAASTDGPLGNASPTTGAGGRSAPTRTLVRCDACGVLVDSSLVTRRAAGTLCAPCRQGDAGSRSA